MLGLHFADGKYHYKTSSYNEENTNSFTEYDAIFLCKKIGLTFDEINQMKWSDLVSVLLLMNPETIVKNATQKDMDNF